MNPESQAIRNIDRNRERRLELSPTIQDAHDRATREVLTNPDYSIQEKDFAEVYGAAAIAQDRAEAARLARIYAEKDGAVEGKENAHKIAEVLEAIVLMQSEMNEWFGKATTLRTTRYDDYKNKVDMLAEWRYPEGDSRVLALAVDVTFGSREIEKKMTDIRAEIDSGTLGRVKYFKDADGNFTGMRNNVPRAVIGISQPIVEELARLWLDNDNKALAQHSVQRLFLTQMVSQLTMMRNYANRTGKTQVVNAYSQALATIRPLLESKAVIKRGDYDEDPVANTLREKTREYFAPQSQDSH